MAKLLAIAAGVKGPAPNVTPAASSQQPAASGCASLAVCWGSGTGKLQGSPPVGRAGNPSQGTAV